MTHLKNNVPEQTFDTRATAWNHVPITVGWDREIFGQWESSIRSGLTTWNNRSDCQVFREVPLDAHPDVTIKMADGFDCGGLVVHDRPKAVMFTTWCRAHVDITVKQVDEIQLAGRQFLHELGHAAGLADGDAEGAMKLAASEPKESDPPDYLLPNWHDVAALRLRYCGRK